MHRGFDLPYCNPTKCPRNYAYQNMIGMETLTFEQLPKVITQLSARLEFVERHLQQKQNEPSPIRDEILTIQKAAEFLHLSPYTIYGLVSKSQIPSMKRGKRLYFSKDELISWVKETKRKTGSETAKEADTFLSNLKKRG